MSKLTFLFALVVVFSTTGCEERFRYPCQDARNWEKAECKRPQCAVSGTCPDQLLKPEDLKEEAK